MKYHISRAHLSPGKPCEDAVRDHYVRIDRRYAMRPECVPAFGGNASSWYADGSDHRIEDDMIVRHLDDEDWFVEIEDMNAFVLTHGPLRIRRCIEDAAPDAYEVILLSDDSPRELLAGE
ncbi:hypothetical protein [Sulfuriroseicoccus oceanibius]|uniref:Uncharacterized protein n=1 Tax=Sulfuriroseicoccus oceanibius TaxID=2707525 RepID=A0A6B3L2Z9_9BACT|nr:hypothetical protein [Sulfuriroseicoccus oceanibius]QQL45345.1 hypothetical protein G3M56_001780 [Sulfuriroseicoccus oceanibius]